MEPIEKILTFLHEKNENKQLRIDQDTELIESGVIDSFTITSLIIFLEDIYDIEIEINEQTLRALTSVRSMHDTFGSNIGA